MDRSNQKNRNELERAKEEIAKLERTLPENESRSWKERVGVD